LRPLLSVVVPVYNEVETLPEFHRRLTGALEGLDLDTEIVYVDDGSADGSLAWMRSMAQTDPTVRAVSLSRNFGHQIAVSAGLDLAAGDAVVVIDSDLQDPPELIAKLVGEWRAGAEVVNAVRTVRHGETKFKRWTAAAFYRLVRRWTDLEIQVDSGDYRLLGRRAVDAMRSMPESFRFLRGMSAWVGFTQAAVPYERDSRYAGESKYPLKRMLKLAMNAFTSFSFVPLQLASFLGFVVSSLCMVAIPLVILLRLLGVDGLGGRRRSSSRCCSSAVFS